MHTSIHAERIQKNCISIVVPAYNEEETLLQFMQTLDAVITPLPQQFEVIYVNDGSSDGTQVLIDKLTMWYPYVRSIEFSKNFGKEMATTAGLHSCYGAAAICIDADLQHPPHVIPQLLQRWQEGSDVVIGVRNQTDSGSILKNTCSNLIYKILNRISETEIIPRATDFRLLDRTVLHEFRRCSEHNRLTRGLIDWLGFRRTLVYFDVEKRAAGEASYSVRALIRLGINSIVSMSLFPLRMTAYLGACISVIAVLLGSGMVIDRFLLTNTYEFSGTAILAVLILFLIGVVLMALGLIAFYIGTIHQETQNRPLYVIRRQTTLPISAKSTLRTNEYAPSIF